jgi:hypothetical protein
MEKKRTQEAARQRKALPQAAAKAEAELAPASAPPAPDPVHISKNERGQLEISKAGSIRVTQTFLGSSAQAGQENTALDNVRFAQVTCALPHSKGNCDDPKLLNIALDGVAALAPRDGMEVMLCSQLVALHSQGMEFIRRAMLHEQTISGVDCNVNRATKTLRTFATMAECLRTYRGGVQQKVTVEHVTVQAAVKPLWGRLTGGRGVGMRNKTANEPHAKRCGWLKNANPPGNPASAPRCGARTRKGSPCGSPAVRGKKRCRMHGGLSTGPRTAESLARSKQAHWKHGRYSAEPRQEMAHFRELLRECKELEELMSRQRAGPTPRAGVERYFGIGRLLG